MKQKFFIFLALIFLIVALIGLNAASYVQQEKAPDSEFNPNRPTYNLGATGTRAHCNNRRPLFIRNCTASPNAI